jgi:hypothetical protein
MKIKFYDMVLGPMASFSEKCNESSWFINLKVEDTVDRWRNGNISGNPTYRGLAWINNSGIIQWLFFILSAVNIRINETWSFNQNRRLSKYLFPLINEHIWYKRCNTYSHIKWKYCLTTWRVLDKSKVNISSSNGK